MATQDTARHVLTIRRTFPAPPERVFQAWTQPEQVKRWIGPAEFTSPRVDVDLRVGGGYRFHMVGPDGKEHVAFGAYREIVPGRRLTFTWGWETGEHPFESVVTLEFTKNAAGGTDFLMTHDLIPDKATRDSHETGWTSTLEKLATYLS